MPSTEILVATVTATDFTQRASDRGAICELLFRAAAAVAGIAIRLNEITISIANAEGREVASWLPILGWGFRGPVADDLNLPMFYVTFRDQAKQVVTVVVELEAG